MATKKTTTAKKPTTKKTTTSKKATVAEKKYQRQIWGIVCIIMSIITIFSILNFDGFLLGFYKMAVSFLIGFGIYTLPIALIIMGVLCFAPFKGNVPLRTTAILISPITVACFIQILTYGGNYKLNFNDISILVSNGLEGKSAGMIGGVISIILEASLSTIGALLLLGIINILIVFLAFNLTPGGVYKSLKDLFESLAYEETDEEIEYKLSQREKKKIQKEKKKEFEDKRKEAKKVAQEEYKENVVIEEKPKKQKNKADFSFDMPMKIDEEIKKNIEQLEQVDEEKREQVDQWILDKYEKIKERTENEKREKIARMKQEEFDKILNEEKMLELERLEKQSQQLMEEKIISETKIIDEKVLPDNIIELHRPNNNIIDFSEILNKKEFETSSVVDDDEIIQNLSNEIETIINNIDKDISSTQEEQFEEIPFIEENTKKEPEIINSILDDEEELKEKIEKDIEDAISENTEKYVFGKKVIIPDEFKSTMRYQTVSNFDQESLTYSYKFPSIDLLSPKIDMSDVDVSVELDQSSNRLIETLNSFGVPAEIINIVRGPSVTRFEIRILKGGIKISKIEGLSADIALSLGAQNVRIAAVPENSAIGIEIPNKTTEMVYISEILGSKEFKNTESKLSYSLGKDITGSPAIGDIAKMPHMLVAGTTGSGKSVCINSMLISLLYKSTPEEVKLILIDPKMVELSGYNGIPHLLVPVVTEPKKAAGALNWSVGEMLKRYNLFKESGVKSLVEYNTLMAKQRDGGNAEAKNLPQIVIVIDELADLMMVAAKEIEESICRIAQMARAAGMHLVIATQRPSSDVITGLMKSNIPSRVSFAVSSGMDSRIILDQNGAEQLIGKGDMLYNPLGAPKPQRLQGCFITTSEVDAVVEFVKSFGEPEYSEEIINHMETHAQKDNASSGSADGSGSEDEDDLIFDAIDIIVTTRQASTSFLQRRLKLGYSRAARILDQIEERGIISTSNGSKGRDVLITKGQWEEMQARRLD